MSNHNDIEYSDKYCDDEYEYRHVILPRDIAKRLPQTPRLLTEAEWRGTCSSKKSLLKHWIVS